MIDFELQERIRRRMASPGNPKEGMTVAVRTITRFTMGLIFLFGLYEVLHGHIAPGGGFDGGIIIALSFIHIMLTFGKKQSLRMFSKPWSGHILTTGLLMYLSIALLGYTGGYFLFNFLPAKGQLFRMLSAGSIPLVNIATGMIVAAVLYFCFIVLITFHSDLLQKKKDTA
jgi:multicomponent Na+:H+ antiporter subunit B